MKTFLHILIRLSYVDNYYLFAQDNWSGSHKCHVADELFAIFFKAALSRGAGRLST